MATQRAPYSSSSSSTAWPVRRTSRTAASSSSIVPTVWEVLPLESGAFGERRHFVVRQEGQQRLPRGGAVRHRPTVHLGRAAHGLRGLDLRDEQDRVAAQRRRVRGLLGDPDQLIEPGGDLRGDRQHGCTTESDQTRAEAVATVRPLVEVARRAQHGQHPVGRGDRQGARDSELGEPERLARVGEMFEQAERTPDRLDRPARGRDVGAHVSRPSGPGSAGPRQPVLPAGPRPRWPCVPARRPAGR